MKSQRLQMSDWSPAQTYSSHRQDLSKETTNNQIVPLDTCTGDTNQDRSNDQKGRR